MTTKRLILGRHSYTEYPSYGKDDLKRELTKEGIKIAEAQMRKLNAMEIKVNQIISSHAVRAIQTTDIYQNGLNTGCNYIIEPFLYDNYTTNQFLNLIGNQNNSLDSILVVAHNPTISDIAYRLTPDFDDDMHPSTLVIIDFDINRWSDIEVHEGKLRHLIRP